MACSYSDTDLSRCVHSDWAARGTPWTLRYGISSISSADLYLLCLQWSRPRVRGGGFSNNFDFWFSLLHCRVRFTSVFTRSRYESWFRSHDVHSMGCAVACSSRPFQVHRDLHKLGLLPHTVDSDRARVHGVGRRKLHREGSQTAVEKTRRSESYR